MKRFSFVLMAASLVLLCACGNNQGKKKSETKSADSIEEQYIKADLKIKLDSLVKEMGRLSTPVMVDIENGELTLTDKGIKQIADDSYSPNYGARPVKRYLQKHVETNIASMIIEGTLTGDQEVIVDSDGKDLIFSVEDTE